MQMACTERGRPAPYNKRTSQIIIMMSPNVRNNVAGSPAFHIPTTYFAYHSFDLVISRQWHNLSYTRCHRPILSVREYVFHRIRLFQIQKKRVLTFFPTHMAKSVKTR